MEIASDVAKIISDVVGFTLNDLIDLEPRVKIRLVNLRSGNTSTPYQFYYAKNEDFYETDFSFHPTRHDETKYIDDSDLVSKLGRVMLISNGKDSGSVLIAPVGGFTRPENDIKQGHKIWEYIIEVRLFDDKVEVGYFGYLEGPNGTPTQTRAQIGKKQDYKWWNNKGMNQNDIQQIKDRMQG
jgi:hypothetical protein